MPLALTFLQVLPRLKVSARLNNMNWTGFFFAVYSARTSQSPVSTRRQKKRQLRSIYSKLLHGYVPKPLQNKSRNGSRSNESNPCVVWIDIYGVEIQALLAKWHSIIAATHWCWHCVAHLDVTKRVARFPSARVCRCHGTGWTRRGPNMFQLKHSCRTAHYNWERTICVVLFLPGGRATLPLMYCARLNLNLHIAKKSCLCVNETNGWK